jgi:hypothetical protein
MLKSSQITAFVLTLTSLFVAITISIANAKQSVGNVVPTTDEPLRRPPSNICIGPKGPIRCPDRGISIQEIILETRPELNDVTSAVAIKQLEALRSSKKATNDDYILLGYFYSLEKKYDQSKAYYLEALELATDEAKKDLIEQELEKLRPVMREPQLGGETKL